MSVAGRAEPAAPPVGAPATLGDALRRQVETCLDGALAEIDRSGRRASATNEALYRRALGLVEALHARVPDRAATIVLCFESILDLVPAMWACILDGRTCVPWHFQRSDDAERDIAARTAPLLGGPTAPVLVTTTALRERAFAAYRARFADIVCTDGMSAAGRAPMPCPGGGTVLLRTSGTTGGVKYAAIGPEASLARFLLRQELTGDRPTMVFYPFDSIVGMTFLCHPRPAWVYLQPERLAARPIDALAAIEELAVEAFGVSSSLAARLLEAEAGSARRYDLSSLRHVGFGSEMIVPDVVRELLARFAALGANDLKVSFAYGMTETSHICWTGELAPGEAMASLDRTTASPTLGRCIGGWSLRIVGADGRPLPPGTTGNIEVWSPTSLFSGYHNDPDLTARSFTDDGWFRTGDHGLVEDGALRIVGREKATIIINGRNISLDDIESPLRRLGAISGALVAAAAVRGRDSTTDELAVFFAPGSDDPAALDALCREIRREAARMAGAPVRHLVPLDASRFPLTPTGKIRRDMLAEGYARGDWQRYEVRGPAMEPGERTAETVAARVAALWQTVLKLDAPPPTSANFFDLGGDSLASAELIAGAEEISGRGFPIDAFVYDPTVARMVALVSERAGDLPACDEAGVPGGHLLLHRLQSFAASWQGDRLFPASLVIGRNTRGRNTPIFWVFQDHIELDRLAARLGPDQPLYGMRSCVGIDDAASYSMDVIETVANRYLWEIMAITAGRRIIIGGNCQGAIIALHLARKLGRTPTPPVALVLMEWSYSYGRYDGPALLIYGRESYTAEFFETPGRAAPDWRRDFPVRTVAAIPGRHGTFFDDGHIGAFAQTLRAFEKRHRVAASPLSRLRIAVRSLVDRAASTRR